MNTLPQELILIIFDNILLITDKRQFLKTCSNYNNITKQSFLQYEKNYKIKNFAKINNHCVEKFTLELCHDKYFDRIPMSYMIPKNYILTRALTIFNCVKLLEIAKNSGCRLFEVFSYAATSGNLEIMIWADKNGCWCSDNIGYSAAKNAIENGHLHIIIWLWMSGYQYPKIILSLAAKYGQLGILKWLSTIGRTVNLYWDPSFSAFAAENGHLEVLKWVRKNGGEWNYWTCAAAASNGHLETLKWARENGCEWNSITCAHAAQNGHLHILKWARENGCDWDKNTCAYAAKHGYFEVLIWARENGCEWDNKPYIYAKKYNQLNILKWLEDKSCPK